MDYLHKVLGIQINYIDEPILALPNDMYSRYRLQKVTLDERPVIFVYPKEELETVSTIKKHLERVSEKENTHAVLILDHLTYRMKEQLLSEHIPFVVEGKQIYLPFMAVYLQERGDAEKQDAVAILPSSQMLLLYFIYHGCSEMMTSTVSKRLGFSAMTVSRASRQLEEMGLIHTEKRGVQKIICSDKTPKELFEVSKRVLSDPVKRTIYLPKGMIKEPLLKSGYSALSEYTMINPLSVECYAAESISSWKKEASDRLYSAEKQCAVELWRYDPLKLSNDSCVDKLSLALSLSQDHDERVEQAVEEMLESVWEEQNGKRN